jgi:hypothetical protein
LLLQIYIQLDSAVKMAEKPDLESHFVGWRSKNMTECPAHSLPDEFPPNQIRRKLPLPDDNRDFSWTILPRTLPERSYVFD